MYLDMLFNFIYFLLKHFSTIFTKYNFNFVILFFRKQCPRWNLIEILILILILIVVK